MKLPRKRTVAYIFLVFLIFVAVGIWGGFQYVTSRFFAEHPNRLTIAGELHPVPFQWVPTKYDNYVEEHGAIILPVTVPGVEKQLYMQLDTGSPSTFLRSGCLDSLAKKGVQFNLFEDDKATTRVDEFNLKVGENAVVLRGGWVMTRDISIDWDKPVNIIGSIGADILDQRICAFDFPGETIHFFDHRTAELDALGVFRPFRFPGRRVMLPAEIDGTQMEMFYDSGCSPFGLFTSKHHYDRYADPEGDQISVGANRFGDSIPVHHSSCKLSVLFGDTKLRLRRVSYVDQYVPLQSLFGRFVDGGFMGNKFLLDSTMILDTQSNEFLIRAGSLNAQ
ncbi:hypothetical protein SH139x_005376 [Planctomycetaceae bacterium SH139]